MTRFSVRKGLAAVLALCMGISLTACGAKETGGEDVKYYRANYMENLPDTFEELSGTPYIAGDNVVYAAYTNDYRTYGIYSYNMESGEEHTYFERTEAEVYDPYAGGMSVNNYTVDTDGNVYLYAYTWEVDTSNVKEWTDATFDDVLNYMQENWGYDEEMALTEWNDYMEQSYKEQGYTDADGNIDYNQVMKLFDSWNLEHIYNYSVVKYDAQGNEVYRNDIPQEEAENSWIMDMKAGKDGMLFLYESNYDMNSGMEEYIVKAYDASGAMKGECKLENYGTGLVVLADGSVGAMAWNDDYTGYVIQVIDPATMKATSEIELAANYIENICVLDEENLLYSSEGELYKYNMTTQEQELYLNWVDCDVSSNSVRCFQLMADGRLLVVTQNYDYVTYEQVSEVAYIEEIPEEEAKNITSITLACINSDEQLEQRVINLNKKNPQTRIRIKTFWEDLNEEEDYQDAMARFVTNMASDPEVDIVYFNGMTPYADMMNFAAKGLLVDLNAYLDSDEEVKREDLMASILDACTYDEKLVGMPTGFSVSTVIGKVSDVGTEPGWTFADMKALLESKEPGTQLFYGRNRAWALQMCLNLGYKQFIDMENANCSFNTQEFIDVLEFANLFPEEFEWKEDEDETTLMNQGKVLLAAYNISDFAEIQLYTEIFGEELTYIGYPTIEGNGALLTMGNTFSVTKNCDQPELAWKLIREYFLPAEEGTNNRYYSYNLSIRHDDFDEFCKQAMSEENNGSWGWGDFEVQIKPATQEQVDEVKDIIANITAVDGAVSNDIMNIINEEAAGYFSGQKTAQQVAETIQSRVWVYLSETN